MQRATPPVHGRPLPPHIPSRQPLNSSWHAAANDLRLERSVAHRAASASHPASTRHTCRGYGGMAGGRPLAAWHRGEGRPISLHIFCNSSLARRFSWQLAAVARSEL
mmetsp:Transcript_27947/g.85303  ORF Transcript_27947/g.85303 Transcript_27947/m.85303 type:complete len:107 (+) Transcript_27947:901-1221(+)